MAATTAGTAVRDYLVALKDPSALRDDSEIESLRKRLEESNDELERLSLRQQLMDKEKPSIERFEQAFVTHAKAWADELGITAQAFTEEGVPASVLRKAGFRAGGRGRRSAGTRSSRSSGGTRSRVTSEEVRSAIPAQPFTIKQLQEASGASPAVVRKVVAEEEATGNLKATGTDPNHVGPGRAPTLYARP